MPAEPIAVALHDLVDAITLSLNSDRRPEFQTDTVNVVDGLFYIGNAIDDLAAAVREHTLATHPPPVLPKPEPWINSGSTTHQKED